MVFSLFLNNVLWPALSQHLCLHLESPSNISPGSLPNCFSSWFSIIHSSQLSLSMFSSKSVSCFKPSVFLITPRIESSSSHGLHCPIDPPLYPLISPPATQQCASVTLTIFLFLKHTKFIPLGPPYLHLSTFYGKFGFIICYFT